MYSNVKYQCTLLLLCIRICLHIHYCSKNVLPGNYLNTQPYAHGHIWSLVFRSTCTASKNVWDSSCNINRAYMLHQVKNAFVRWGPFLSKMIKSTVWASREVRPTAFSVHLQFNPIPHSMWTDGHHCPITLQLHALGTENVTITTDSIRLINAWLYRYDRNIISRHLSMRLEWK